MPMTWLEPGKLAAAAFPSGHELRKAAEAGVTVVVNLELEAHDAAALARLGLAQVHVPVADFSAPNSAELERGVAAIDDAIAVGGAALVHCRYGVGRTGTLLACWYIGQGLAPEAAIRRVREARPGSVETSGQMAAVVAFAHRGAT